MSRRSALAGVLGTDGVITHVLYSRDGAPWPSAAMRDTEQLMRDQAAQLGRRPVGDVDWQRDTSRDLPHATARRARLRTEVAL